MYQVDLIKGEIPKQREVKKTGKTENVPFVHRVVGKLQICKNKIVGARS